MSAFYYIVYGFEGYPARKASYQQAATEGTQLLNFKYNNDIPPVTGEYQPQSYYDVTPQAAQYNNNIWKRRVQNSYDRLKRSLRRRRSHQAELGNVESVSYANGTVALVRRKRQSTITGETLCQARSQFIVPKAALNNKGNWMYVVNMPEVDSRYTQLVKTESCVSQTCSGLCSLPQGYSSRCEQKYVQKRLVALEGSGDQLYTDVFWFPSCCVCTLSNS
ncbi:hypothetical protein NQ315_015834 [Exocentrus adspersus]|uniref:Spaetzle domain-containing protein n=1 Tax=Exocentrus adspersus TaxID=1586481 RepID=A0AAV8W307_9CUCU|nr:hypothetical protein NQ315_015834 [Exocentrus adspersus]